MSLIWCCAESDGYEQVQQPAGFAPGPCPGAFSAACVLLLPGFLVTAMAIGSVNEIRKEP